MVPHAIVVDFALALLVTSFICDLIAATVEDHDLRIVAWWTLQLGTLAAAFAVLSGFVAAQGVSGSDHLIRTLLNHRNLAIVSLTCFAACLLWRGAMGGSVPERYRGLYWAVAGLGTVALILTGYHGGILVYRLGVGVVAPA
jgi:uncharacterized membrane protein